MHAECERAAWTDKRVDRQTNFSLGYTLAKAVNRKIRHHEIYRVPHDYSAKAFMMATEVKIKADEACKAMHCSNSHYKSHWESLFPFQKDEAW